MSSESTQKEKPNKFWQGGFLTLGNIRDILLISLLLVLTWKLINSSISFSFQAFSFTDLLSVLLAFFAIALSTAFYFKATETSNRFYDNSYKFTKEMSEILGRIESGFGEKLRHIDEGYNGLRDKFDKMPFDVQQAREEERKEEKHIKEQENERNKIILDLMEKARVADGEKEALLKELEKHTNELDKSRIELRRLQRKINEVESDIGDVSPGFIRYLSDRIEGKLPEKYVEAPTRILAKRLEVLKDQGVFEPDDLEYMEDHGLTSKGFLTPKGAKIMRIALEKSI
ncbi:hypothetical protein [Microbulbifer sp. SSSA005]|uniref:hypothetical protein n=1 Tax=unclassified Microbulbifer TaxID=2619833 RepID=UPI004039BE57